MKLREDGAGVAIPFSVPEDMARLENTIGESDARFVVIDPITAFLSERIQSHNDASVRKAMTPLGQLAQKSGAAFLLLRHLNKDTTVTNALYRGGGSIGFSGSARSVLLAAPAPGGEEGLRVLAQTKGNLSRGRPRSHSWRVVPWDTNPRVAKLEWVGFVDLRADELLQGPDGRADSFAQREAIEFLRQELADGPLLSTDLLAAARKVGITSHTLQRARGRLGVHPFRTRDERGQTRGWSMHLPDQSYPDRCDLCRRTGKQA